MRAFVTGATGFIGANLVRLLLQQGYEVRALVRSTSCLDNIRSLDVEIVRGGLNDPDLAGKISGCQALFHVAACYSLWQVDRKLLYTNNILGTRNILAAARQAKIDRVVYTSSVAAIGVGKNGQIIDETYQAPATRLIGYYKKSKYYAEREAIKAIQQGQDIVIVNPSTPLGSFDIKPTPTGDIILRFLRRQMPFYVDTGLNLIDVRDVAWGHLLALEKGIMGDRYILGNQNLTLKAILDKLEAITDIPAPKYTIPYWVPYTAAWIDEKILSLFGKKPSLSLDAVRMSRQTMFYDSSKAINKLGLPQSSVDEALKLSVTWFGDRYRSNNY
jgi:dihydroflavonol-4-reductase